MPAFDPVRADIHTDTGNPAPAEALGPLARAMAAFTNLLAGDMEGEVTLRAPASPSP
jgi:hypothetical protein